MLDIISYICRQMIVENTSYLAGIGLNIKIALRKSVHWSNMAAGDVVTESLGFLVDSATMNWSPLLIWCKIRFTCFAQLVKRQTYLICLIVWVILDVFLTMNEKIVFGYRIANVPFVLCVLVEESVGIC